MFTSPKSAQTATHRHASPDSEGMKPRTRRALTAAIALALVLGGGTAAFAYWTSTGHGQGSATTGTTVPFTLVSTAPSGTAMSPGGATQTVAFTVTNPATTPQTLSSVVATVANATTGAAWTSVAGCGAGDYTVGTATVSSYGPIPAGGTATGSVTITMNNTASNQNACIGATVPLYFAIS
jgi:hypothetical protein